MTSIEQKVERLTEEVKELKKRLTFTIDATKVELWIAIKEHPEYSISSFGRVRRMRDDFYPKISLHKSTGYYHVHLNGKQYLLHRLLAQAFIPNPEGKPFIDHIDGDRLNNCLSNLRRATCSENSRNRKKQRNNTSDYTGVYFHKTRCRWKAQIYLDGKHKHLGYFHTKEKASAVYEAVAKKEFGEFYSRR